MNETANCGKISSMAKGFKNATLALALTVVGVVASCRAYGASPDILRGGGCSQESRVAALCKRILKAQTKDIGEIPFYKIGTFGKSPNAYISRVVYDEYVKKYSYPTKGDILISAAGTICRAVVFDGEPAYFQDSNIVWLEHDRQRLLNEYLLCFYLLNPWSISVGVTIPRIYNGDIESLEIPAPPIAAQREIVSVLDAAKEKCEKLKVAAERGLRAAEDLRKAILAEAFE